MVIVRGKRKEERGKRILRWQIFQSLYPLDIEVRR
jgi:hypothetical protein